MVEWLVGVGVGRWVVFLVGEVVGLGVFLVKVKEVMMQAGTRRRKCVVVFYVVLSSEVDV